MLALTNDEANICSLAICIADIMCQKHNYSEHFKSSDSSSCAQLRQMQRSVIEYGCHMCAIFEAILCIWVQIWLIKIPKHLCTTTIIVLHNTLERQRVFVRRRAI